MRTKLLICAGVIASSLLGGCAVNGLSFVQDDRVEIVTPEPRAEVALPVQLRWTARDVDGSFAVLVDREPPRPGRSLLALFANDEQCKGPTAGSRCASDEFLAEKGVYRTTARALSITRVPELTGNDSRRQFHEATVILLDNAGRRVGESAWSVRFEVMDGS